MTFSADSRRGPALLIGCLLVATVLPIRQHFQKSPQDSFPLSHYPMFSARRAKTYSSPTLRAGDANGRLVTLHHRLAGSGGFNEVRRQLRTQIERGAADKVCTTVAKRLSRNQSGVYEGLQWVEVATGTHHLDAYFHGETQPRKVKVHARCAVPPMVARRMDNQTKSQEVRP